MSHCTNMETSTGWLCYDPSLNGKGSWFIGFDCPSDGLGGRWKPELQPLIDNVIKDAMNAGFDIEGEILIRNKKHRQLMAKHRKKE